MAKGSANFNFGFECHVIRRREEHVILVNVEDLDRIISRIKKVDNDTSSPANLGWASLGIGGTALFTAIGFLWSSEPNMTWSKARVVYLFVAWLVALVGLIGAGLCWLAHRKVKKAKADQLVMIAEDLEAIKLKHDFPTQESIEAIAASAEFPGTLPGTDGKSLFGGG